MPIKILPNQSRAFQTPAQAWAWALNIIEQFGDKIRTEDGQLCKEVMNLQVTVLEPCIGWPIQGSGWDMAGLNRYAEQLLSPENPGFDYTYGERLNAYGYAIQVMDGDTPGEFVWCGYNQVDYIISKLRENPTTRRAIAITWSIPDDPIKRHVPCLQSVDFLYRAGKLHEVAYFRSQDVLQAWPANVYGLSRLLDYVAGKTGMVAGSVTTFSASAHIYEK